MSLQTISGAATVALASTFVVLLVIKSWQLVAQSFAGANSFPESIMIEAAQQFRDELERLKGKQTAYLALALMFLTTFTVAVLLRPQNTFGQLPLWQTVLVIVVTTAAACYGAYRFAAIAIVRRRVAFVRDAHMAIGHSLQKLTANRSRVFHEVACPVGIIDHVVVGLHGIYVVNVVARRPARDNRVRLAGNELSFAPGRKIPPVSVSSVKAKQLAKAIKMKIGHEVRVRTVIAVPGWEVESQESEDYLAVNERNIAMMRGWKDEKDYLMNEDVEAIHAHLTAGGKRKTRGNKQE